MVDTQVAWNVLRIAVFIISSLVVGGLAIAGVYAYMMYNRYKQYNVIIYEKDTLGNTTMSYDQGAVFPDRRTGNILFHLRKHKTVLCPDKIPYARCGNTKVVQITKYGLKDFRFNELKVGDSQTEMIVGEKDLNWYSNGVQRINSLLQTNNLMAFAPFILLAFVSIIILIIFIYFFKNFSVLKDVAVALQRAAEVMASNQATAQVIN